MGNGGFLEPLRPVVLERLIRYYRYLSETAARRNLDTITSAQLGAVLGIDPTQVRKDFGAIGLMGISRVGYEVCEVCRAIRLVFGFDHPYPAVLVGAGHLGNGITAPEGLEGPVDRAGYSSRQVGTGKVRQLGLASR